MIVRRPNPTESAKLCRCFARRCRSAFTLVELLVVVAIITMLASMLIVALAGVQQMAKEDRTKAQIARLHEMIMERWEAYRTRAVPIKVSAGTNPRVAAARRLNALTELMRMEVPDRKSDVIDPAVVLTAPPSLSRSYFRKKSAAWTEELQGAECLYMIVASMQVGDSNGLDFFKPGEIGDVDGDGMLEILDAWGTPIEFLRWAPGFRSPLHGMQQGDRNSVADGDAGDAPDPFDPLRTDGDLTAKGGRWEDGVFDNDPFALFPLIFSAGPDKAYDIVRDGPDMSESVLQYSMTHLPPPTMGMTAKRKNDPYYKFPNNYQLGTEMTSASGLGEDRYVDNLTNHFFDVK
jgi:prepilin-type N-terminal cleavage/methylation domain-containing protein